MPSNSPFFSKNKCKKQLAAAGFSLTRERQKPTPDSVSLTFDDQWIQLISNSALNIPDPLNTLMGEPGLWKAITNQDRQPRKVFEFPLFVVTENNPDFETLIDEAKSPLLTVLQWARDTQNGKQLNDWRPPSRLEMLDLLSPKSLTVQCGPYARQGELICKPQRLALRFPLIFDVSDDLPDTNFYWLRHLLIDAQNRWKLVRIGFRNDTSATSVQAEIDLSGAPHAVLAGLLRVALAALHAAATWVVPSAEFLVDRATDMWALRVHDDAAGKCDNINLAIK